MVLCLRLELEEAQAGESPGEMGIFVGACLEVKELFVIRYSTDFSLSCLATHCQMPSMGLPMKAYQQTDAASMMHAKKHYPVP